MKTALFLTLMGILWGRSSGVCANWDLSISSTTNFKLRSCDGTLGPFAGHIPGSVHTDLMQAGLIKEDPLFRYEEKNLSWVPQQCWLYESAAFRVPAEQLGCPLFLRLKGVDSVATITVNGVDVDTVVNAHRDHTLRVAAGLLKASSNVLQIRFPNVLEYAKKQAAAYPYSVPETVNYNVWAEPSSRNFVRKAGSDFGWDWGPAFVSVGVSGDIKLFQEPVAKLDDLVVTYELSSGLSSVTVHVDAVLHPSASPSAGQQLSFQVYLNGKAVNQYTVAYSCSSSPCKLRVGSFQVDFPKLWWPKGWGEQYLYKLRIRMADATNKTRLQSRSRKVGFRTARLIQQVITDDKATWIKGHPKPGSFYFEINGIPMYMMGSNFIPIDSFQPRVLASDRAYLLQAALASNMNMLRIWGGGIYQPNDFYELADELGVLLWQEVMLACALYPRDGAFLAEVEAEVKHQVLRLASHPSIVIFGGNNENEISMNWFAASRENRDLYVADYQVLFGSVVYPAMLWALGEKTLNHSVVWVDSSPSNGMVSMDPYVKAWGQGNSYVAGDIHFYDYKCDCELRSCYPAAKFVSEFGSQSMPSFLAYETVTKMEDWHRSSKLMLYRQRHEHGNREMEEQIVRHFKLPVTCPAPRTFDMYLFLTQVQQSNCYATSMHRWRSLRGVMNTQSVANNNMGILYWQFNDIWQGPSWSSMEYSGRWKPLQYTVRGVYEPLLLSVGLRHLDDLASEVTVSLINEHAVGFSLTLVTELVYWNNSKPPHLVKKAAVVLEPMSIHVGTSHTINRAHLEMADCEFSTCYWKVHVAELTIIASKQDNNGYQQRLLTKKYASYSGSSTDAITSILPLTTYKQISLPVANYSIVISNLQQTSPTSVSFTLRSTVAAPYLFMELANLPSSAGSSSDSNWASPGIYSTYGGWFSRNNFLAEANRDYQVTYSSFSYKLTAEDVKQRLQVRSLQHVYNCSLPMVPTYR